MKYDDAELTAFHEGTLDPERAKALLRDLERDETLARRLMAADPAAPIVQDAFARIAVPDSARIMPPARTGLWRVCAVAASIGAAAVMIWSFLPPPGEAWHRQVSAYQVLYTPQTIAMIEPTEAGLAEQFAALNQALSTGFGVDALSDIEGLDLLRAQLLGFEGAPLGQIVFADAQGRPIALCLMAGGSEAGFTQAAFSGLNTVSWGSATHGFLLVGPVSQQELHGWAKVLQPRV
ncbi:hypothetical protein [uncultured Roseobacter sp.]|uniref:hypothetical protein n=1 Tax=uncultured Roseobacter sp. TaxID=114847 RepID=UPI0026379190|nr:hypothetical protein [uncultured Roseobacter sp.]